MSPAYHAAHGAYLTAGKIRYNNVANHTGRSPPAALSINAIICSSTCMGRGEQEFCLTQEVGEGVSRGIGQVSHFKRWPVIHAKAPLLAHGFNHLAREIVTDRVDKGGPAR